MENKVEFGLKNVHVAPITAETDEAITYGTIIKITGAVSFTQSPTSESTDIVADDKTYMTLQGATTGEGTLTMVKFPEDFKVKVLKYIKDTNNVLVENSGAQPASFALMCEYQGDKANRRVVYYKCTPKKLGDKFKTVGKSVDEVSEELSITINPDPKGYYKAVVNAEENKEQYKSFFTTVYKPAVESL